MTKYVYVATLLRLCSFWPMILHCRDKVLKCRDIVTASMSYECVATLLRDLGLE